MSWRVSLDCTKAEAEALPDSGDLFPDLDNPPVIVAEEPDPARPDLWRLHAYFDEQPGWNELKVLETLADEGDPVLERLDETTDWVTVSQAGLEPIRAGRFFVHTPPHYKERPESALCFEIDAGLAFGTGQHATTAGCLAALDRLERSGASFSNIADIGTGTGLLAFAGLALWPDAKAIATDIDPIAVDVSRDNAAINGVKLGMQAGELLLAVADGMDSPMLAARAPFDLLIANILAGPLIELAPAFAKATAPGGTIILAGLLDTQADAVIAAYESQGATLVERGPGEWTVLVLQAA
ncbi:50S ribosomal protein L11 methyltransferase [Sphingomonas alba]|uniref:Ribosomal protein L11 methyltransferase n=1 Tax=Sphingomonas alba TaxID=2908208 RepID=A0ABT0RLJ6_9SPHN|nr:50S ribosomal protein L11 methyltransferase [Sphingomonas alba]MCL6683508.1 50S ribosomal protein L11 methyltransferase [Sphingomonas alba]